jgi:copper chaperone
MTEVQLQVPEVHCEHCKSSLEGAVGALGGVSAVDVVVADAMINVGFDEKLVTLESIKATIEEQGYAVFGG